MENENEELLGAWLRLSSSISNQKLVSDMTFNEAFICHILYRCQLQDPQKKLTATDLCSETKMLKSQMNRTLTAMEKKHLIIRKRSQSDKRQVLLSLNMEKIALYQQQHIKVLDLIDSLAEKAGRDKVPGIIALFHLIADTAEEVIR